VKLDRSVLNAFTNDLKAFLKHHGISEKVIFFFSQLDVEGEKVIFLDTIYVKRQYRKQGIAKLLLKGLREIALIHGFSKTVLIPSTQLWDGQKLPESEIKEILERLYRETGWEMWEKIPHRV